MSRKAMAAWTLSTLALVLALAPWTVTSERVKAAFARQLRSELGLNLRSIDRATVSILPVPRLKLAGAVLSDESGAVSLDVAHLKGELRLSSLFSARLRISDLRIADARIRLVVGDDAHETWATALDGLRRRIEPGTTWFSRLDRIVLIGTDIEIAGAGPGPRGSVKNLTGIIRWPEPAGDLDISLSGRWNGENVAATLVGLNPRKLLAGATDPIEAKVTTRLGRLSGVGDLSWGTSPRFVGAIAAQTASLGALARWTGIGLDFEDLDRPLALTGEGSVGAAGIELPKVSLDLGRDRLDGALAFLVGGRRQQLRATLAGEALDLGWILPIADPTRANPPLGDYDVRLSASALRMGPVRMGEMAAGILVNAERLEVSLGRASVAGGSVRGRLSASLDGEARDIRGQLTLDRIDAQRLLADFGVGRGVSGTIGGQMSFEAVGERSPDLLRNVRGRLSLTARDGEIAGIALGEAPRRIEGRPGIITQPEWRGGRTRFGQVAMNVEVGDGVAEITEAQLDTSATQTSLRGRLTIPAGLLTLQTTTRATLATEGRPALVLDVRGPLEKLTVSAGTQIEEPTPAAAAAARP